MAVLVAMSPGVAYTAGYPLILRALIDNAILPRAGRGCSDADCRVGGPAAAVLGGDVLHQYLVARLVADVGKALRLRVFQHVQDLQVRAYERFEGGDILSRCITSTEAIEQALLFFLQPSGSGFDDRGWQRHSRPDRVAAGSALPAPYATCLHRSATVWQTSRAGQPGAPVGCRTPGGCGAGEHCSAASSEGIWPARVARQRFQDHLEHYWHSSLRIGFLSSLLGSTLWRSGAVLLVVCLSVGSVLALQGQLSVGALVAFFELLWWMVAAFQSLADAVPPFKTAATAQRRLDELLSQPIESASVSTAHQAAPLERQVCFEEVSFQYDDGVPALERVTLTLPANASIAVVGPSGSGKSTLLSMLLHFYEPSSGRVTMDGLELCAATAASMRAQIGVVFQESLLFDTSVRENIRLGRLAASDEDIEQAARAAELHDAILDLPDGYDTRVGERGGHLSGGQRQRLALARALVREPRLLCSMRPPRHLTRSLRPRLAQLWIGWLATARSSPRRTGLRRSPAMTGSLS